jgi:catechol 2,3-dioxygenase-like lactoylglutathione lyase family enzyme
VPATFLQTVPIVRIFDEAKAREFYVDFLGFRVDWEHRFEADLPLYMQVSRGNLMLHLSEHVGDACPGSTVFVRMTGIDILQAELIAKRYKYLRPGVELAPWGAKCMEVIDPFGNRIRFNEDL